MPKLTNFWQAIRANHKRRHQLPAIKPRPRPDTIPLSSGQQRLWAVEQLNQASAVHNLRSVTRLDGPVDVTILQQSLQEITNRHEILRTSFPTTAGQPEQCMATAQSIELPVVTVLALNQEAEIKHLATELAQRPFDLAEGPLWRLKLLRLSDNKHILLRTIHHIISDRWSDTIFLQELTTLYQAFLAGKPSPLPALPIQYADFCLFQQQWPPAERLAAQQLYWQQQLQGDLQPARLPISMQPANGSLYQGGTLYLNLSGELTEALKSLAQREGVSLFVIILAAFKTLLYQYSGQEDVIVCTPVAGRHQPELKKLIGYFNSLQFVRTSLAEKPSFQQLIQRVSQVMLGLFENQDMPIQQVAQQNQVPSAVLSRVMVALQNVPSPPKRMGEIELTRLDVEEEISNFDLSLSMKMNRKGQQLMGVLRYKKALFESNSMQQFLDNFQTLLEQVIHNPTLSLSELPRFTTATYSAISINMPYIPPQNDLEQSIATIWQQVLQLERISTQANFFELGGRSLAMMQIANRLQETLKQTIPLVELFKRPTIKEMAAYLKQDTLISTMNTNQIRDRTQQQREALKRRKQQVKNQRGKQ